MTDSEPVDRVPDPDDVLAIDDVLAAKHGADFEPDLTGGNSEAQALGGSAVDRLTLAVLSALASPERN